jgi:hypothetical protein
MKIVAAIYSLALGGVALWAWGSYFLYEGSTREHLLPGIALNVATLPSSLLVEMMVGRVPWILSSPIAMLSIVTGLGGIQVVLVWLIAVRFKFPSA